MIKISPSLLAADFARFGEEARRVQDAGADMIHMDIMDGHFVPNLTFGPEMVAAVRENVTIPLDVHLMMIEPDWILPALRDAGADYVTIQAEATAHLHYALMRIRDMGMKPGVALNPATPLSALEWVLDDIDMLLIMTVNPGFGGQKLIPSTLGKVRAARALLDDEGYSNTLLEVDGGVGPDTIAQLRVAGANVFVAGTSVFTAPDASQAIKEMRMLCGY